MLMEQTSCAFMSPLGWVEITTLEEAIVRLEFVQNPKKLNVLFTLFQKEIVKQLENYFGKRNYHFNFKIAQLNGNTKDVRALAVAISKNPVLIIIPCHSVVESDGSHVPYSGGLEYKRAPLVHEGYSN